MKVLGNFGILVLVPLFFLQSISAENKPVNSPALRVFDNALLVIGATYMDSVHKCAAAYIVRLNEAEEAAVKKGDLDSVVQIRDERERFGRERAVEEAIPSEINPLLKEAMEAYLSGISAAELEKAKSTHELAHKYLEHLELKKVQLTKERKIEEALEVQKEIDLARKHPLVVEAFSRPVKHEKPELCPACNGADVRKEACSDCRGARGCKYCNETGRRPGLTGSMVPCFACNGTGKCRRCKGSGEGASLRCAECKGSGQTKP